MPLDTRTYQYIGRSNWSNDGYFNGNIYYAKMYYSELTPSYISALNSALNVTPSYISALNEHEPEPETEPLPQVETQQETIKYDASSIGYNRIGYNRILNEKYSYLEPEPEPE